MNVLDECHCLFNAEAEEDLDIIKSIQKIGRLGVLLCSKEKERKGNYAMTLLS